MKSKKLLKKLSELGFPLFEKEEKLDADSVLAQVAKGGDFRLWEGFPVVLANSAEKGLFSYENALLQLKQSSDKSKLNALLAMSLALYDVLELKFSWAKKLLNSSSPRVKKDSDNFKEKLKRDLMFTVAGREMSAQRLKTTFRNYFRQNQNSLNELLLVKEELGVEYALSQVFSPKQKELFLKKLKSEKFTKTEKEYFSRSVKKKALALANPELHRLARKLLEA
ncbi:MAG: hypothetical protein A2460_00920 [Omnitrophica WOR_2 bacterium RIFOXYC2_FULL_43_9]|nr:MAG: hypothetical protein A2460_00920 [Omnitrophica WOR_2 bacterium RIFOXYC2_FULL_43_9]